VLSEISGATFEKLSQRDQRRVLSRTIRCIVITEDSHADIKFDVFERLNTGAVRLSDQELRNSIYRGPFNDLLKATAEYQPFQSVLRGQLGSRMEDSELVLRFVALADRLTAYKPPLRQFLNEYMRDHKDDTSEVLPLVSAFKDAADTTATIFGEDAYRRIDGSGNAGRTVNKALFDTVMLSFFFADREATRTHSDDVLASFRTLLNDPDFDALVGRATADRARVFGRIVAFSRKLEDIGIPTRYREAVPEE
jgi:hypothetical protein